MKYLKLYESADIEYYVLYMGDYFEIYASLESAQNYFINFVNEQIEMVYHEDLCFFEFENAVEWYKDKTWSESVGVKRAKFYSHHEKLGKKAEMLKQSNKYNL